jgi:hypothetical protein
MLILWFPIIHILILAREGLSTTYGKPIKVSGGLKELENRRIKIKNYRETDGSGKTITHRRDEEDEYQ